MRETGGIPKASQKTPPAKADDGLLKKQRPRFPWTEQEEKLAQQVRNGFKETKLVHVDAICFSFSPRCRYLVCWLVVSLM